MSQESILAHDREINNPSPFDDRLVVNARFAGGPVMLGSESVDWLGDTLVRVEVSGLASPLMLRTFEARDLALALLNLSAHVDEERPREIRRQTIPGQPQAEELQGVGL